MNTKHNDKNRKPLEWTPVKNFIDEDSGLTIQLSVADGFRPRYSFRICRRLMDKDPKKEARFVNHVSVFAHANNGVVTVDPFHAIIAKLAEEAHAFIHQKLQEREDEIIETKIQRETRQMNHGKKEPAAGLKTLAKRDAERKIVVETPAEQPATTETPSEGA